MFKLLQVSSIMDVFEEWLKVSFAFAESELEQYQDYDNHYIRLKAIADTYKKCLNKYQSIKQR